MTETDASDTEVATELRVDAVVTQPSAPPAGILIGCARCSTEKQDLTAQREILRGLGVAEERVYLDHGLTGTNRSRRPADGSRRRSASSSPFTALFAIQFSILGLTVYLTLCLQSVLGYRPAAAGALVVPTVVAAPLLAGRVGRWTDRTGTRLLTSGLMLLASAALVWIAIFAAHQQIALLLPAFLAFGIARPIATVAGPAGTIAAIPRAARGLSSALVTEARQLGAVMGVAVLGLVLTGLEVTRRRDLLAGVDSSFGQRPRAARDGILANSIHTQHLLAVLTPAHRAAIKQAAASAFLSDSGRRCWCGSGSAEPSRRHNEST